MAFYYNPVTNEFESTIQSLDTRFGLNEISTRAKTLSPTKSYIDGGRIGLNKGNPKPLAGALYPPAERVKRESILKKFLLIHCRLSLNS